MERGLTVGDSLILLSSTPFLLNLTRPILGSHLCAHTPPSHASVSPAVLRLMLEHRH